MYDLVTTQQEPQRFLGQISETAAEPTVAPRVLAAHRPSNDQATHTNSATSVPPATKPAEKGTWQQSALRIESVFSCLILLEKKQSFSYAW